MACEVTKVAVDPKVRRGGFGRYMLWTAVNAAKAGGASEVRLRVECTNAGAVKMYEQQGFIVDVGRGVDGISFRPIRTDPARDQHGAERRGR
jgi:GNAT superfamily N-acetyltransferase